MKKPTIIIVLVFLSSNGWTDIAPNPIILKSIMTYKPCEIQMVSETVDIDLYSDSSFVSCTFHMTNHGDSLTLPIGFPVMNFFHWGLGIYSEHDKDKFEIFVDNFRLDRKDIQVPDEMKSTYKKYKMAVWAKSEENRKLDSIKIQYGVIEKKNKTIFPSEDAYGSYARESAKIYDWREGLQHLDSHLYSEFDSLMKKGNYPWYVWKVKFNRGESKTIKVNYMVPSGIGYGGEYRFMKYLISTGTGWKDKINKANINVKLHNIQVKTLETITPTNYKLDKNENTIRWTFLDIEPTTDSDIFIKYYNPGERRRYEKSRRKRAKQLSN